MKNKINDLVNAISQLDDEGKIAAINEVKLQMHTISPFKNEPVDCVLWVKNETVYANDYNPNSVAPPEMELLKLSVEADGFTQPIVSMMNDDGSREVIDGFHRNRVGKEYPEIEARLQGYLPVVSINSSRENKEDRMAATIRHNRARGKHKITAMSDIVLDLKKRNWSDAKIAKNLGMDADEVLRLSQIGGIAETFKDAEFSMAWEAVEFNENQEFEQIEE
jgi:ParB-like chromosome segregation protein Spo0J